MSYLGLRSYVTGKWFLKGVVYSARIQKWTFNENISKYIYT